MLSTCLLLQDAIEEYFETWANSDSDIEGDRLEKDEWKIVQKIKDFLESLKTATKMLEGHNATLEDVLPSMDFILKKFEDAKATNTDPILAPMFNSGWLKLDKYYQLADESPAYVTAIILQPNRKWQYIEKHWDKAWHGPARRLVQELWEKYKLVDTVECYSSPPQTQNEFADLLNEV